MANLPPNLCFGLAWVGFALAVAVHVADEAAHDFLSVYNPMVRAMRTRLPFLPLPTFRFPAWIGGLMAGIVLLLLLSPLAFGGDNRLRLIAWPLAVVIGISNALLHFAGSAYFRRRMPGVYSAPILMIAAICLLAAASR
jgi:hypothetical protein